MATDKLSHLSRPITPVFCHSQRLHPESATISSPLPIHKAARSANLSLIAAARPFNARPQQLHQPNCPSAIHRRPLAPAHLSLPRSPILVSPPSKPRATCKLQADSTSARRCSRFTSASASSPLAPMAAAAHHRAHGQGQRPKRPNHHRAHQRQPRLSRRARQRHRGPLLHHRVLRHFRAQNSRTIPSMAPSASTRPWPSFTVPA